MKPWIMPTFGAFVVWDLWSFIPKITVRYITPKSPVVFTLKQGLGISFALVAMFLVAS